MDHNVPLSGKEGMAERQLVVKGRKNRLVREVNGGNTTQTEDMIESQWRIGAKKGVEQSGSEEKLYKEEGVGKIIKTLAV